MQTPEERAATRLARAKWLQERYGRPVTEEEHATRHLAIEKTRAEILLENSDEEEI